MYQIISPSIKLPMYIPISLYGETMSMMTPYSAIGWERVTCKYIYCGLWWSNKLLVRLIAGIKG